MVNSLVVSTVGVKNSPRGLSPVIAATSNKVGVNMPHGNSKVLVEPSQKKIDLNNMVGLYLEQVLEILIMS